MSEYIEAEGDYFVCPYCGSKIRINPEIFSENLCDDEAEVYCEECDRSFYAERDVIVNYYSVGKIIYEKNWCKH